MNNTRFPRRQRAHSLRSSGSVPPLLLKRIGGVSGPSSDSATTNTSDDNRRATPTSVHSVPTPTGTPGSSARVMRPNCPRCGQDRHVHRLAWWDEKQTYVFSCSFVHPERVDGNPAHLCSAIWIESHREKMECKESALTLRVEMHGGQWTFACRHYRAHECKIKK